MISIVIPSYKDPLLHKTIDSLLDKSESEIEIIIVFDGYKPAFLRYDSRISPIYKTRNEGMREAINTGVSHANGQYIMRVDEHCMFGQGYDRILTGVIEDNWIVTPRRYKLNPETWERFGEPIDYEKLVIGRSIIGKRKGCKKFHAKHCPDWEPDCPSLLINEKTAMQGSCWLMPLSWWKSVIGRLQSKGYGTHYQDTTEMLFKTWKAGGKLMLNKGTWYAHKAREFPRTHHYPTKEAEKSFTYALEQWREYYPKIKEKDYKDYYEQS